MSGEWFCVNGSAASRAFMTCALNNQQRSEPLGGESADSLQRCFVSGLPGYGFSHLQLTRSWESPGRQEYCWVYNMHLIRNDME